MLLLNLLFLYADSNKIARCVKSKSTLGHCFLIDLSDNLSDDGSYYFDEKLVGARGHQSPLSASASVVRGITAVAAVTSENLNVCFHIPGLLSFNTFFTQILSSVRHEMWFSICSFLGRKFWVWPNFSLALEFLEVPKIFITKLMPWVAWKTLGKCFGHYLL